MAWASAIVISSQSASVTITLTSATPATSTEALTLYNSSYGGYTRNTQYEPKTALWQYGSDAGNFTISNKQNYRVEWYSTARDFGRTEVISASDYSLFLASGRAVSISTVEALAHKRLYNTSGFVDDYLVYAKYIERYLLTFDGNGGTPATQTQRANESGEVGDLPTVTRAGYEFVGWFTDPTGGTQITSSTIPTGPTTYYAHWTANTYIAIFDPQGGTLANANDYWKYVTMGQPYGALPTPTRSGYTFGGWYTDPSGGTQVTSQTIVTTPNDHTLYAHWTAVAANVTLYFDAAGGTVSPTSRQVTEGQAYGTLPTPTRSGYTFAGWYTRATGGDAATAQTVAGDEDVTIYAHWTGESLTITFNANGGTVSEASRTVVRGSQYKRLPIPVRDGYNFDGWYTAATGGTQVTAGDYPSASTTLYAHWSNGTVPWLVVTTWN